MKNIYLCVLAAFALFTSQATFAGMILSFESAERSWVGQGESHTVSLEDGYIFFVQQFDWDNSLEFYIASLNSPFGPNWDPFSAEQYYYWSLNLAAPFDQILAPGHYEGATRYPFQDDDEPGLTFSGNHRGNNQNSGFFEVLDIAFDSRGILESIAVDFTQYGETNPDWWIHGQLRYNSNVPLSTASVPQAPMLQLFALGIFTLVAVKSRPKATRGPE